MGAVHSERRGRIGPAVRADFRRLYPANAKDPNVLPKRRQSHQGDKLCDVSTVPLVARWPVFLARGSDADGEPHYYHNIFVKTTACAVYGGCCPYFSPSHVSSPRGCLSLLELAVKKLCLHARVRIRKLSLYTYAQNDGIFAEKIILCSW